MSCSSGGLSTVWVSLQVLKSQLRAKDKGYADTVYLDSRHDQYLEEVSSCNIFVRKGKLIKTPTISVSLMCSTGVCVLLQMLQGVAILLFRFHE